MQAEWAVVEGTDEEEAEFCRLMGALGLSPYAENAPIAQILEQAASFLKADALMDLCLVSSPAGFATAVGEAAKMTAEGEEASVEPLVGVPVPGDSFAAPAWLRGVNAARSVRNALGISETDPEGGTKFLTELNLKASKAPSFLNIEFEPEDAPERPIVWAVSREALRSRFALLQKKPQQRRFEAARAAYMAWTSAQHSQRLLTMAVTRDQQASRAFAAEMMAPLGYIKKHAKRSQLSTEDIHLLANDLQIGPNVVRKQALNNGLQIAA